MRRTVARVIVGMAWLIMPAAIKYDRAAFAVEERTPGQGEGQGPPTDQTASTEAPAVPPAREGSAANPRERARALFAQGQIHYSLAEYDQAIARFREAYQLSSAPVLLFNIAQAHRLKGECARALEIYRHFVRLAPESPQAGDAAAQIQALSVTCTSTPAPRDLPLPVPAQTLVVVEAEARPAEPVLSRPREPQINTLPSRWSRRARVAVGLLATGVVVASGTGLLYRWNDTRYDGWNAENRRLTATPGTDTTPSIWIARQNRNDALLRSIQRVDTTVGVLAVISAACVLGSATLGILPERGPQLAVRPGEIRVAWQLRWH